IKVQPMRQLSVEQRAAHALSVGAAHGSGRRVAQGTGLVRYSGGDGHTGRAHRACGNLSATGPEFGARFDLPFASEAETVYRSVCMFLLARNLTGASDSSGFAELKDLYENLHVVNRDMSRRL